MATGSENHSILECSRLPTRFRAYCRQTLPWDYFPTTRITMAAGIASLVGPACAVLPDTDYLPDFPSSVVVWLLAAIGAIGIGIGVFAFSTGSKVGVTICVLTNIPVLAY